MADDDRYDDVSDTSTQVQGDSSAAEPGEGLPDRLRVHSLARMLGTTSRRVLEALRDIDGRARSAQSSLDRAEAVRVRDVLAAGDSTGADSSDIGEDQRPVSAEVTESDAQLTVETTSAEQPTYMPLFVAPQPVESNKGVRGSRGPRDSAGSANRDDSGNSRVMNGLGDEAECDDLSDSDDIDDTDDAAGDSSERNASRRRRRGRRGRGRGRGEQHGSDSDTDSADSASTSLAAEARSDKSSDSVNPDNSDSSSDSPSGDNNTVDQTQDDTATAGEETRRRRRRRRRKVGSGDETASGDSDSSDDPPNTVIHERTPRASRTSAERAGSEIQGITGSTRLEAKRQRRRDGRDAGRRRPPILSEAEFLARREAVDRVMVVRDKVRAETPQESARYTQIAVMEDGVVVEHFVTSAASASLVGNIYVGIVQNVLPSMEAAFVDIGRGRNGVLYAGEVNWEAAGLGGSNRKIEQALNPGDYVIVQVSKDPVGHKGARLTTQVSLAGRYLVYVPGASSTGISRKLPDTERQRLKGILRDAVPDDAGVIIRTASEGVKEEDIYADITRLQQRWTQIAEKAEDIKAKAAGAAVVLYEEPDVLVKVIRDLFNEDFSDLIVYGDHAWETINSYIDSVAPELLSKLTKYDPASGPNGPDIFTVYRIEEQLAKAMDRKVWLPSGGTLVIERTEAMTVVDVNTGKFTGSGGNLEQTVTKNNLEAAEEIVRQLRLRDIGGIIVIDFIDMVLESNRDLVLRRLTEALARDRTRHQVSEVTSLGLVQLTRKRIGTGLIEAFSTTCSQCNGRGLVLQNDPIDNAPSGGRKSEVGTRRNKQAKKSRPEEPVVAKAPAHSPGEHPMFKAMAAVGDKNDDDSDQQVDDRLSDDIEGIQSVNEADDGDIDIDIDIADDGDDSDDDSADDDSDDSDDSDDVDFGDDDLDIDTYDDVESAAGTVTASEYAEKEKPARPSTSGRSRRRAAARPAGPPGHDDA